MTHFCVPNFTADLGRSSSVAIAQAMLPYLLEIARAGVDAAVAGCAELARGVYTLRGGQEAGRPARTGGSGPQAGRQ